MEGIARAKAAGAYEGRNPTIDRQTVRQMHADGLKPSEIAGLSGSDAQASGGS